MANVKSSPSLFSRKAVHLPHASTTPASVKRDRESSLSVKGCILFNLLPPGIRNMTGCTVDNFKKAVDEFLANVPDQPTVSGLTKAAATNSLIDQLAMQAGTFSY